jgi:hypothetical protein
MGTLIEPVPVTGLAANFSPMPRMAPPPLGREMDGAASFCPPSGCFVALSGEIMMFTSLPYTFNDLSMPKRCAYSRLTTHDRLPARPWA